MYLHSDIDNKKSIHFIDPSTRVTRFECLNIAQEINVANIIENFYDDWVNELGDKEDRTNMEAIATWISKQHDILLTKNKLQRVECLQACFRKTMDNWKKVYLDNGYEIVDD